MMGHVYGVVLVAVLLVLVQQSCACGRKVMASWLHGVYASAC